MASECIALSLLVGIFKNFDIYYSGYIQAHCQKNKKIKGADQILPEVYGTTLSYLVYLLQEICLIILLYDLLALNVPDEAYSR